MGSMSIWHWVIVAVIVMLLFGRGKVSDLMGDVAKGIKAFKKGMTEEETPASPPPPAAGTEPVRTIPHTVETSPGTAVPASHLRAGERKPV